MNARVKLILGIVFFFLVFLGAIAYFSIKRLESDTQWIDHSHQIIHSLQITYAGLKDAQTHYTEYLLTRKPSYASACETDMSKLEEELRHADSLSSNDILLGRDMGLLQSLIEKKTATIRAGLGYVKEGRPEMAVKPIQNEDEKITDRQIKELVDQMSSLQIWALRTRQTLDQSNTLKNVRFMTIGTLLALLACGLAGYSINRYIHERQEALNHLKSSEEKSRFLAETANDAFITTDSQGVICDVNPAGEAMFGHGKKDLLGRPFSDLMPGIFESEQSFHSFDKFVAMSQSFKALELVGRKKDGSEFPLELSLSKWKSRDGLFYTAIIRDILERRFFVKTLLNNEHRLFQFLDAIPVGVLVRDPTGGPYYANQKAKYIFGPDIMKAAQPGNQPTEANMLFSSETGKPYPVENLPSVLALQGFQSNMDDIEVRSPGGKIYLEASGSPILDENGIVKFSLTSFIDITHQKQITESLKEREEFFRNLFEEGPIGMNLAFSDGIFVNVNRAFSEMLGYPKNDLVGHPYMDFTFPEDVAMEKNLNQKLFNKILPHYQIEKRYITKKGDILWCKVSASVIRDLNDEPLFRLAIVENITDQKSSDMALKESEEKFRTLTESANDAIISADSRGKVIFFNPTAEEIFGYTQAEILGNPISSLMSETSWKANFGLIQNYLATGNATIPGRTFELTGRRKSGEEFPAEISYFSWKTQSGLFFTSIMRDITARKQIEEMKNDLISVVSHQLKTPVAEINGYIENLLEGLAGALTPKQREYLSDMREIGQENYRLISDLLSLSKIERGVVTVNLKPVPIQQVVETSIRDYEAIIQRKGLKLFLETDRGDILVLADIEKTAEAIRNIVNNAIKCTDKGSITLRTSAQGDLGIVEIRDTGIGMSPETLSRLFTKERVMGAEAARAGAGLGLYIARSFMELQKGGIEVASEIGKGSVFYVKIPKVKGDAHV